MSYSPYSAATSYQQAQISQIDPVNLIVMLYDGALARIVEAKQRFRERNDLQGKLAATKAQAIVGELRRSLNVVDGQDLALNLDRLYLYLHDLLVKAILHAQVEPLEEATALLHDLRSAWAEVATQHRDNTGASVGAHNPAASHAGPPPEAPRLAVRV